MAEKDYASRLWENLNDGLDTLYQKYKSVRKANAIQKSEELAALPAEFREMRDTAAAEQRIAKANTDRRMAEKGLGASGEAVRRDLLQNAALQQNLSAIDRQEQSEKSALETSYREAEAKLDAEEADDIANYVYKMNEAYFNQLEKDRQDALEQEKLRLQKEQNELENKRKEEELALKKAAQEHDQKIDLILAEAKLASSSSSSSSSASSSASKTKKNSTSDGGTILGVGGSKLIGVGEDESFSPDSISPKAMVQDLVEKHTYKSRNGTAYCDEETLASAIRSVLSNYSLTKEYRYEVYLYAHTLGYL